MNWRLDENSKKKYDMAQRLDLTSRLREVGWAGLSAKETGRIGAALRHATPK